MTQIPAATPSWPPPVGNQFGFMAPPPPESPWRASFWIVQEGNAMVLAYGWATARPDIRPGWSGTEVMKLEQTRMYRLQLECTYAQLTIFLGGLWMSRTLLEAATTAGPALPSDLPCASFSLGPDEVSVSARYAASPWMLLPERRRITSASIAKPGRNSPTLHGPVLVTALMARDKGALANSPPVNLPSHLAHTLQTLTTETGLRFTDLDAGRFGDIEMFLSTATDVFERPQVHIRFTSHGPTVTIDSLPNDANGYIRCTQESSGMILADDVCRFEAQTSPIRVEFRGLPSGPHDCTVQVWGDRGDGTAGMWFARSVSPVRQIATEIHVLTEHYDAHTPWLASSLRDKKRKTAAERMCKVRRHAHASTDMLGGEAAAFVSASHAAAQWARQYNRPASGTRLFPKGDRLEFATWLRDEMARSPKASRIMLVDPFIDEWGIEMVARSEVTSSAFEVITALDGRGDEAATLQQLRDACARFDLLLAALRVRVAAIRGDHPFHDRFLLAFDAKDNAIRGFQLSNSLSGAAKQHPLLVTEISNDVLSDIATYVVGITQQHKDKIEVIRDLDRAAPPTPLGDDAPGMTGDQLVEQVQQAETDAGFAAAWLALAARLARTHDAENYMDHVAKSASVCSRLERWLATDAFTSPSPAGVSNVPVTREPLSVLTRYTMSFVEAHDTAWHTVGYYDHRVRVPYGVFFAFSLLARRDPARFVSAVATIVNSVSASTTTILQRASAGTLLAGATSSIVENARPLPPSLSEALLLSSTPFLRAFACAAAGHRLLFPNQHDAFSVADACNLLAKLPVEQRLFAGAAWIGHLRVQGNRRNGQELEEETTLRQALMRQLVMWWPENGSTDLLVECVRLLEGPRPGGWATGTTEDFLGPLVSAGKQSERDVRDAWCSILLPRMLGGHGDDDGPFSARSDAVLTEVTALLCARVPLPDVLAPIAAAMKNLGRFVTRPFARSEFARWSSSYERVLWIEAFARLVAANAPPESKTKIDATYIVQIAIDVSPFLWSELDAATDPSGLRPFVEKVRSITAH